MKWVDAWPSQTTSAKQTEGPMERSAVSPALEVDGLQRAIEQDLVEQLHLENQALKRQLQEMQNQREMQQGQG